MRSSVSFIFAIFILLSFLLFGLSKFQIFDFLQVLSLPVQQSTFNAFQLFERFGQNQELEKLRNENLSLTKKLIDQERLKAEISALSDQFLTTNPRSNILLAASIVAAPRFLPGLTQPESFVINKGEKDNVREGDGVIFKDNLIGRVVKTSKFLSSISLVTNSSSVFSGRTTSNVLGIVRGQGNGDFIFDNVLLSDTLKVGDVVLSSGDLDLQGRGLPEGLIVGKIISVEKKPSELFQRGKLKALIDFSKLTMVFVMVGLPARAGVR